MDAVSDEICEAVHNAYEQGYGDAIIRLKEHEAENNDLTQLNTHNSVGCALKQGFNFDKGADYENGTAFGNRHGIAERSD